MTKQNLEKLTKADLMVLANTEYKNVKLSAKMLKADMIAAIQNGTKRTKTTSSASPQTREKARY
jgi:hypothetical protein